MRLFKKKVKAVVCYRVLIADPNNIYRNSPTEFGMKYIGTFMDYGRAMYNLEGHLGQHFPDWFFNQFDDEYQDLKTKQCVGRIKRVYS